MPKIKVLIIGYGSIGRKYFQILKKINSIKDITIFTSQKNIPNSINKISEIKKINPDIIIISTTTDKHYKYLNIVNSTFKNKKILVEKPLFIKLNTIKNIKNRIFVGYNLRLHPVIKFIKKWVKKKKLISAELYCGSYLPNWRKQPLKKTSSYDKKLSGGILSELSHEIDYARFLFGNLKNNYLVIKKLSRLKIKDDDYCNISFLTKNSSVINVNLNYYSLISKRFIILDTNKGSLQADLINGNVITKIHSSNLRTVKIKSKLDDTYKEQIMLLINNKLKNLCSYQDAYETLKNIKLITRKL